MFLALEKQPKQPKVTTVSPWTTEVVMNHPIYPLTCRPTLLELMDSNHLTGWRNRWKWLTITRNMSATNQCKRTTPDTISICQCHTCFARHKSLVWSPSLASIKQQIKDQYNRAVRCPDALIKVPLKWEFDGTCVYRMRPTWADGNESRLQNLLKKQAIRMTLCQKDNHCCPLSKVNQGLHLQNRVPGFTIPKLSFESLQCRTLQDQNITNSITMTNQDSFTTNMELHAPESSTFPCLDLFCSRRTTKNVFKAQPRMDMEDEMENMCPPYLQTNSRQYTTTVTEKRNEAITKMGSPATYQSACLDLVSSRVPRKKCFQAQPRMKMEVEIDNLCQTYLKQILHHISLT